MRGVTQKGRRGVRAFCIQESTRARPFRLEKNQVFSRTRTEVGKRVGGEHLARLVED